MDPLAADVYAAFVLHRFCSVPRRPTGLCARSPPARFPGLPRRRLLRALPLFPLSFFLFCLQEPRRRALRLVDRFVRIPLLAPHLFGRILALHAFARNGLVSSDEKTVLIDCRGFQYIPVKD